MSPAREAKYELLLENKRTTFSPCEVIVFVVLLVVGAIIASCVVAYLAWCLLQPNASMDLPPQERSKEKSAVLDVLLHRLKAYEHAFVTMNSTNVNDTISVPTHIAVSTASNTLPKLVCYYALPTKNDLMPGGIDPKLCTHINIASLSVLNKSLSLITSDISEVIRDVVGLKSKNPALKVLICIGGYSQPGGFNDMVTTHDSRKKFIREVMKLLDQYKLDGVDLDWEFPAWPNGEEREKIQFNQLLREMREAFDESKRGLLLSVAVGSPITVIDEAYDVAEMAKHVDYVNLMAYDYHFFVWYMPLTGANAPLYRRSNEKGIFATLNTNWSSWYWLQKGMPKEKIIVGVPTYGHSFKLRNGDNHDWGAPASGIGAMGTDGFVTYPQVCWFLDKEGATQNFDIDSEVPYAYLGQEWISYDNVRSVTYKTGFVVNNGFGGVMIFSLNQDDYKGVCSDNPFILTQHVRNVLFDDQL